MPRIVHPRHRAAKTAVVTLIVIAGLASCTPFSNNSTAATVDGRSISRDKLESIISEFVKSQQLPITDGVIAADDARSVLAGMIKANAYGSFLAELDQPVTKAQRAAVEKELEAQNPGKLSNDLRNLIIGLNSATAAIKELKAPSDDAIKRLYEKSPSLTGALCARHIVVKKKTTADRILRRLAAGDDFVALAKKYSIEPAAKTTGGALGGQTADGKPTPCMSILEYQQGFDPAFTAGAIAAKAGVPYGPVQSSFGWHVILLEKWDAVADAALEIVKAQPGPNLATGWLANADISVDPAYGRWSPATGSITAG